MVFLIHTAHKNFSLIIWPGTGNINTCGQLVPWDLQNKIKLMNMDHYKNKIHELVFFYSLKWMTVSYSQPRSTFCEVLITHININRINAGALRRLVQLDVQWTGTVHWQNGTPRHWNSILQIGTVCWQTCTMYWKMCAVQMTNKVVQCSHKTVQKQKKIVHYVAILVQYNEKFFNYVDRLLQYLLF